MEDGVALLESEVRELVRRQGLDPARDTDGVRSLVAAVVADYDERSLAGLVPPLADPGAAAKEVVDAVAGLGPLQRYLDDPEVEEVWINEPAGVTMQVRAVQQRRSPHSVRSAPPSPLRPCCHCSYGELPADSSEKTRTATPTHGPIAKTHVPL